jgi:hypothetical protein
VNDEKHAWIRDYLAEHFPGSEIEQKHDFDLGAQSFKVHLANYNLILKVSDDFASDNNEAAIALAFKRWDVPALLQQNSQRIVLITNDGPLFRSGR